MSTKRNAVVWLRLMSVVTMLIGAAAIITAIVNDVRLPLFPGVSVPGWAIGASAMYMGLRYWRRIPEMEKNLQCSPGFSWANFKITKTAK